MSAWTLERTALHGGLSETLATWPLCGGSFDLCSAVQTLELLILFLMIHWYFQL